MSFGKYWNHVCKAKASKEQKWRLRCQDRGSLTNGATKLILSSYFITRLIITLLKTSARRIFGEWNYQATETWGRAWRRRPREKLQVSQKKIQRFQRGEFSLALRLCLRLSQQQDESLRSLVFLSSFWMKAALKRPRRSIVLRLSFP